jgi:3-hydroxymyristoyl/3-hydroxydecanoyl-(acyl carrier protein) dehydratase
MLLNDFFIIDDWQPAVASAGNDLDSRGPITGSARAILRINWGHPIFEGHFPGRPVVPGACLLQIVKELVSMALDSEVRLTRADQIKFISMIGPDEDETVWMNLTWNQAQQTQQARQNQETQQTRENLPPGALSNGWQVRAEGTHAGDICFRFKGSFLAGSDYAD